MANKNLTTSTNEMKFMHKTEIGNFVLLNKFSNLFKKVASKAVFHVSGSSGSKNTLKITTKYLKIFFFSYFIDAGCRIYEIIFYSNSFTGNFKRAKILFYVGSLGSYFTC